MAIEDFDEYIKQSEPHKREKGYAWQTAIGLQAVDGLKPSDYLIETARWDIEGEITIDEAERLIKSYYQPKEVRTAEDDEKHEADLASTNIRRIFAEKTFAFTALKIAEEKPHPTTTQQLLYKYSTSTRIGKGYWKRKYVRKEMMFLLSLNIC